MKRQLTLSLWLLILFSLLLSACGGKEETASTPTSDSAVPIESPTPEEPTATPVPLAVQVNGEGIYLSDYKSELKRYQDAETETGQTSSLEDQQQAVIENYINQLLLSQAARENGYEADEQTLDTHVNDLIAQSGNNEILSNWKSQYGYSDESFSRALKLSVEAAWQRDQIVAAVPLVADQINARQILFETEGTALSIQQQLGSGIDFEDLAYQYDALTGGYLGWFPNGYLTQPELNEAVFALESGQFTDVIATSLGYHIIQVIERDTQHELAPNALNFVRHQTLENWLQERRASSQVDILIP